MDGQLNADVDAYLLAAMMNVPPPPITSDPLVMGDTPIEDLLRILGLAANADDPEDYAESIDEHAGRDTKAAQAAEKFGVHDQGAAAQLTQQLPQLASGLAGTLASGLSGILGPLTQIPQQFGQAFQSGLGALGPALSGSGRGRDLIDSPPAPEDFEFGDDGEGDDGGGGLDTSENLGDPGGYDDTGPVVSGGGISTPAGPVGRNDTAPTAALGPAPVPSASTAPASAPVPPAPTPGGAPVAPGAGMPGMPVAPAAGLTAGLDKETKTETKRVSAPTVRNGAPVQGRITVPPPAEDIKAPVVIRRISPLNPSP